MELFSKKALQFEGANMDLPIALDSVFIRIVEIDDHLRIMLEITEDCTSDDLSASYWLINEWRRRLIDYQGRWVGWGDNELLERLSIRQEIGRAGRG